MMMVKTPTFWMNNPSNKETLKTVTIINVTIINETIANFREMIANIETFRTTIETIVLKDAINLIISEDLIKTIKEEITDKNPTY